MTREVANDERTAKDIGDELKSHATSTKKEKEDESVERHSVLGFKCVCVCWRTRALRAFFPSTLLCCCCCSGVPDAGSAAEAEDEV